VLLIVADAAGGPAAVVAELLAAAAEVDATDVDGRSALSHAAAEGNTAVVEALLRRGAAPGRPDGRGWPPLVHAAARGHTAAAIALLDHGALALGAAASPEQALRTSGNGLAKGGDAAAAAAAHGHALLGGLLAIAPLLLPQLQARTVWAVASGPLRRLVESVVGGDPWVGVAEVWEFVLAQRHAFCLILHPRSRCCASVLDRHLVQTILLLV
jgi:ankyrin repeat protein